jgi:vacuolar-type H+-ATPase subunit D/Vma8
MTERGRAGRARLEQRLVTAEHGALLLDRKDRILADELERLQLQESRSRQEWERCARDAADWLIRTAALDGRARIASAGPPEQAEIAISWGGSVGVAYPEEVMCDPPIAPAAGGSSALSFAAAAHRAAVAAGVRYAGVRRAIALVSTELTATRIRRRAIENRWIPRLTSNLSTVRRELDEQELEDTLRLRWATTAMKGRD